VSPRVAVVGAFAEALRGPVFRCAAAREALASGAVLTVVSEADWLEAQAWAPASSIFAVVTRSLSREACGQFLLDSRVRHVLFEGATLGLELQETIDLASGEKALESASLTLGEQGFEVRLHASTEEPALVAKAAAFAEEVGARGRAAENWLDALSETLTNALYNAPRENRQLHRAQAVAVDESQPVKLRVFANDRRLAFAVTDPFGSLTPGQFQGYLARSLHEAPVRAVEKAGGAGLGLMMMFDRLERLVAMVEPGRQTTMVGIGPLAYSRANLRGRTVQYFSPL